MKTAPEQKDVVIIGGGPAGLSAALMLGRARKQVLLCDGGPPRNSAAEGIHGFVTRDGIPPKEFRRIAHEQLAPYGVDILLDTRVTAEQHQRLERAGVRLETRKIRRLIASSGHGAHGAHLEAVELEDGTRVAREVLFSHPPQHQTEVVRKLGVALDEQGFVRVNEHMETSVPGVHAAGDLTTRFQGASAAAGAGTMAGAMMNHALNMENAAAGLWPEG